MASGRDHPVFLLKLALLFAAAPLKRPRDAALHRARSGRRRAVLRKLESIELDLDVPTEGPHAGRDFIEVVPREVSALEHVAARATESSFGKTLDQSTTVIARLGELREFGLPILMGLSRKRFISAISPSEPHQRIGGSIAGNLLSVMAGANIVRVHDVAETVQALQVMAAIQAKRNG